MKTENLANYFLLLGLLGIVFGVLSYLIKKISNGSNGFVINGIPIIVIILFLLSFHIVLPNFRVFPKDGLTFSHTLITTQDIDEVIDRYNNANHFEKQAINNEPFIRKLKEKGFIKNIAEKESE